VKGSIMMHDEGRCTHKVILYKEDLDDMKGFDLEKYFGEPTTYAEGVPVSLASNAPKLINVATRHEVALYQNARVYIGEPFAVGATPHVVDAQHRPLRPTADSALAQPQVQLQAAFRRECLNLTITKIQRARQSIRLAAFTFDHPDIIDALRQRAMAGVDIWIIFDPRVREMPSGGYNPNSLQHANISVRYLTGPTNQRGDQHNKFIVIDSAAVVTGSFNFTNNATTRNWENSINVQDLMTSQMYLTEFDSMLSRAQA
jgi:phosphatidylserine/phosphatidylglycerophosphate/cardiolipin synthase-like enzyme